MSGPHNDTYPQLTLLGVPQTKRTKDDFLSPDSPAYGEDDMSSHAEEVTHMSPPEGGATMPCCGRTPFEVSRCDRITLDPRLVTCPQDVMRSHPLPGGGDVPPQEQSEYDGLGDSPGRVPKRGRGTPP